ncbi:protein Jade-1 [Erpetoichthys calabaricus]|uniref:Protein Jade-1 n=1 Tax=Erpetoichthys calabaricus TaxID=27687 RepID=A0A8C4TIW8_ERPCA|nr:protein Jade-1 [Erpetoichthys calabaricus]XP_028657500.1 protein Jade-1 [Erpetoichthys calabaricus]XP_028657501.1 protein Jade-1 [Erpetoichthys calabaricus]XP_028657502.1 protein Jade-1 [Erpetoichthys calabaricus]XP_051784350.1 protein Jade-1 [Erpetoichthys calabaricus]
MKRTRLPSSSDDSDNGSHSTSWSQNSRLHQRRNSWSRHEDRKPSEVFRTDLITAMKLHDSHQLNPDDYYILADSWRQEWEKGVQVPVSPESVPIPGVRTIAEKEKAVMFTRPRKYIRSPGSEPPELGYVDIQTLADSMCRYDLNEMDAAWLELINEEFEDMGMPKIDELTMERVMEEFERRCYDNMNHAIETQEGLGIEYDEDVVCDVCQSPDGEDGNEMVFCDKCNICVHQACYGILKVPEGSWLCRTCALGVLPKCLLCPKKGGAMKPTPSGTKWVHVSCALWIPEVSIGSPEKMEPITKVSHIPSSRWALICRLCKEKTGACIQCSAKNCRIAFHVTCAFQHGLNMKTILAENDEVKFKSFCQKHSGNKKHTVDPETGQNRGEEEEEEVEEEEEEEEEVDETEANEAPAPVQSQEDAQMLSLRKQKLQQLEDDFFSFVNIVEVAHDLHISPELVDFIYNYWKLKRKTNFNKPLITPKRDEEDNLAKQEQDVLFRRLQLFTHLRQDLERVRNLTYMVTRREKMKRSICKVQEQIFHHHIKLLEEEIVSGKVLVGVEDALYSGCRALPLEAFKHCSDRPPRTPSEKPCSRKGTQKNDRIKGSGDNRKKVVLKEQGIISSNSGGRHDSKKELETTQGNLQKEDRPRVAVKPLQLREKKSDPLIVEHKKKDVLIQGEDLKHEHQEKSLCKPNHKSARYMEEATLKQSENKRAQLPASGKVLSRRISGETVPKCNGTLKKVNCNQSVVPVPTTPASPMKNWGGFKIPKKGERLLQSEGQDTCQKKPLCDHLSVDRAPLKESTRAHIKTETENDGYIPDAEMSDSEMEAKEKKCRPQRLSTGASLNRRYGADFLRRSILAS